MVFLKNASNRHSLKVNFGYSSSWKNADSRYRTHRASGITWNWKNDL